MKMFMFQGEFTILINTICPCEFTKSHKIKFNFYLNKKLFNVTEVKGNITLSIIMDNTLYASILNTRQFILFLFTKHESTFFQNLQTF